MADGSLDPGGVVVGDVLDRPWAAGRMLGLPEFSLVPASLGLVLLGPATPIPIPTPPSLTLLPPCGPDGTDPTPNSLR